MRRAGQVVSKSELLEHVWDSYDSLDLNVVEVYAGYLRRKIDAPFGRAALQTVRVLAYGWPPTAADPGAADQRAADHRARLPGPRPAPGAPS